MPTRVQIETDRRTPGGSTNAYLLGREDALLVDPGARSDALDAHLEDRTVAHLAATHTHPDHVGAVAHYADVTGATVWARAGREDRFERATGVAPDRTFREGTTIPADRPVTVMATPGHAPDHVAFLVDGDAAASETPTHAIAGDLAIARGSVMVGARDGDMRAYLTSLRRMLAGCPGRLYPGHGPEIDDPERRLGELLAHRLDRERRVREAVGAGAATIDEILDLAYDKDLTGVRAMAADTVAAHLEKLAVEGDVRWDGERVEIGAER